MTKRVTREQVLTRLQQTDEFMELSTSEQGVFLAGAETALRLAIDLYYENNGLLSPTMQAKQAH